MDIIILIIIFYCIYVKYTKNNSTSLEKILKQRNFSNIRIQSATRPTTNVCITAEKSSMKYLFVKYSRNNNINLHSQLMQNIKQISNSLNCDRIIIYYYNYVVPIELTKIAATYNIEIWNRSGTSNFSSYRTVNPNTNNSRLAKTLKPENISFEHKPNGVIAKDTCHITPTTSPIQENPKSFFNKKGPQRL